MNSDEIKARLEEVAKIHYNDHEYDLETYMRNTIDYIEKLERGLEVYQRERDRFKHAHPEITGAYFLSGGHGETDKNMLPQFVTIVPAYGAGWEQVYEKTERTVSYEGS